MSVADSQVLSAVSLSTVSLDAVSGLILTRGRVLMVTSLVQRTASSGAAKDELTCRDGRPPKLGAEQLLIPAKLLVSTQKY